MTARIFGVRGYVVAPPALPPAVRLFSVRGYVETPPTSAASVRVFSVLGVGRQLGSPPGAFAGADLTDVEPWTVIDLEGAATPAEGATITGWAWSQLAGTPCEIVGADQQNATVEVPGTIAGETLTFGLIVTDSEGQDSNTATIDITTLPATTLVVRSGALSPARCSVVRGEPGAWGGLWPTTGALIGVHSQPMGGNTLDQQINLHEMWLGRQVDIIHTYGWLGSPFPDAMETARAQRGQIILASLQATNNSGAIPWATVAAGGTDAAIDAVAAGVKSMAPPVIVNFENEPETLLGTAGVTNSDGKVAKGSAADYVAAYRRFVDRIRAAGATNARFGFVVMGVATTNRQNQVASIWPGESYVDVVGFDPYTRVSDPGGLKTFNAMIGPWYTWATTNLTANRPYILAEYGAEENPLDADWKGDWFVDVADQIDAGTYPLLKALCYFDHTTDGSGVWDLHSSAESEAGYLTLAGRLFANRT